MVAHAPADSGWGHVRNGAANSVCNASAQELLVWLHRVTPEGHSQRLPALVKVSWGKAVRGFQVDGAGKPFVFPLREVMKQEQTERQGMEGQLKVEVQLAAGLFL